jgi:hypothetical protein
LSFGFGGGKNFSYETFPEVTTLHFPREPFGESVLLKIGLPTQFVATAKSFLYCVDVPATGGDNSNVNLLVAFFAHRSNY